MLPLPEGAGKSTEGRNLVLVYFFYEAHQQSHQELNVWKNSEVWGSPQHPTIVIVRAHTASENEYGIFYNTVVSLRKEYKLKRSSPFGLFSPFLRYRYHKKKNLLLTSYKNSRKTEQEKCLISQFKSNLAECRDLGNRYWKEEMKTENKRFSLHCLGLLLSFSA